MVTPKEKKVPSRPRRTRRVAPKTTGEETSQEAAPTVDSKPRARLLELYRDQVLPTMMQEFSYRNVMEVPRLKKVVLNIGLGEALTNPKAIESASADLTTISGQKPLVTRARRAIAGFKLRQGVPIGTAVTLRGYRMSHFLERLFNAALPRIRDFRGMPRGSFDGRGNYSTGIREQVVFPEIDYNEVERIRGLQITIVTSARTDAEAARLLELLGMPFARQE